MKVFLGFTIQDWLMLAVSLLLILCVLEIRRLKKTITQEIQRKLLPQLILYIDKKEMFFYLKNEGFSIVRNIEIEDSKVILDDSGFKVTSILRFENTDFLKSQEGVKLKFKVFDENKNFLPESTERIFPHLFKPSFNIAITCSDIEGRKFRFMFSKREGKFYTERVEYL